MSMKIKALSERGDIDGAIRALEHSALDSQSTSVWNTLIKQILLVQRFKLAYSTFTDMKRRGFKPNSRTYHTLLSGFAKAHGPLPETELERAGKIYEQYKAYCDGLEPGSSAFDVAPTNAYLSVLANAGQLQPMFDVFWAMPTSGPLSPDLVTFTELINAIRARKSLHAGAGLAPRGAEKDVAQRNADDVSFLWKRLVAAASRGRFSIDSYAVTPVLFALANGSPELQSEGFAIIHEYLGLSEPGVDPKPRKIALSSHLLTAVLELCASAKKNALALHYLSTVMESKSDATLSNLRPWHMLAALRSNAILGTKGEHKPRARALELLEWMLREEKKGGWRAALRPNLDMYKVAISAGRKSQDWAFACRLLEWMAGYRMTDFSTPLPPLSSTQPRPSNINLPRRFVILPDAEFMQRFVNIALNNALATKGDEVPLTHAGAEPLYQCLRFITLLGTDQFFADIRRKSDMRPRDLDALERSRRGLARHVLQLVELTVPKVPVLGPPLPKGTVVPPRRPKTPSDLALADSTEPHPSAPTLEELEVWRQLGKVAKFIAKPPKRVPAHKLEAMPAWLKAENIKKMRKPEHVVGVAAPSRYTEWS